MTLLHFTLACMTRSSAGDLVDPSRDRRLSANLRYVSTAVSAVSTENGKMVNRWLFNCSSTGSSLRADRIRRSFPFLPATRFRDAAVESESRSAPSFESPDQKRSYKHKFTISQMSGLKYGNRFVLSLKSLRTECPKCCLGGILRSRSAPRWD